MKRDKLKNVKKEALGLEKSFAYKIKSVREVSKIIGTRPRIRSIIMCHGTFDIVHPGHIRQLIYAKSKADILIVSVTIDKHVAKRPFSPYVPHELRALNIAAFEIVDYVLIDHNPTPIENILDLQPDFFVKGFEYSQNGVNPKTKEEISALESYGGKMLFSPGDIVYSSSKIITRYKPNLALDHLLTLLTGERIMFEDLKAIVKKFNKIKVHVVGDVIVDKYTSCHVLGPASGSTALSVTIDKEASFVGGAGVVAKHLSALGAKVILTTILGKDENADFVLRDLNDSKVEVNAIIDSTRPTTTKQRYIGERDQKLLQVDTVDNSVISENVLKKILRAIRTQDVDAIIFSDFRHGIFNSDTIPKLITSIPPASLKVADSQVSNRWGNILQFLNFDLITPNEKEARFALGDQDTGIRPLAQKLYNAAGCKFLILKLNENGLLAYRSPGMDVREYIYLDTLIEPDKVINDVGAGDALLSASTLGLVTSKNIVSAAILGNIAAAYECTKMGNVPVTRKELVSMITNLEKKF